MSLPPAARDRRAACTPMNRSEHRRAWSRTPRCRRRRSAGGCSACCCDGCVAHIDHSRRGQLTTARPCTCAESPTSGDGRSRRTSPMLYVDTLAPPRSGTARTPLRFSFRGRRNGHLFPRSPSSRTIQMVASKPNGASHRVQCPALPEPPRQLLPPGGSRGRPTGWDRVTRQPGEDSLFERFVDPMVPRSGWPSIRKCPPRREGDDGWGNGRLTDWEAR